MCAHLLLISPTCPKPSCLEQVVTGRRSRNIQREKDWDPPDAFLCLGLASGKKVGVENGVLADSSFPLAGLAFLISENKDRWLISEIDQTVLGSSQDIVPDGEKRTKSKGLKGRGGRRRVGSAQLHRSPPQDCKPCTIRCALCC